MKEYIGLLVTVMAGFVLLDLTGFYSQVKSFSSGDRKSMPSLVPNGVKPRLSCCYTDGHFDIQIHKPRSSCCTYRLFNRLMHEPRSSCCTTVRHFDIQMHEPRSSCCNTGTQYTNNTRTILYITERE